MGLVRVTAALAFVIAVTLAGPAASQGGQEDTTRPRVYIEGLRTCILSHTCFLFVESNEDAELVGTGRAVIARSGRSFRFKRIERRVKAKEEYELSFALRRRARRVLRRALLRDRRVIARERVEVTDESGNTRVRRRSVPIVLE
jgi:hypothetical protein